MQTQLSKNGKLAPLREVGEILQEFINNGRTVLPENSIIGSLDKEYIDIETVRNLKPLRDFSFLQERGISKETLEHSNWQIFLQNTVYDDEKNTTYKNTCVRLFNDEGVQGFSQRNRVFKGAMGNRFNSLACSIYDKKRPITNLFIGESIIDCISHFQLNPTDENILYISTEGSLTEGHINTINKILKRNDVEKITPITDNDRAGQSYTLKLLGNLNPTNFSYTVQCVNTADENKTYIQYVGVGNHDENEKRIKELFNPNISDKYFESESEIKFISESKEPVNECRFEISFPYEKELLYEYSKEVGNYKFQNRFEIQLPLLNDFNDDLKKRLG